VTQNQWDASGYYGTRRDHFENTVNSSKHTVETDHYVDNSSSYAQYDGGGVYGGEVHSGSEYNNFSTDEQYNSSSRAPSGRAHRTNSRQSSIDQVDVDVNSSTDHQQQPQLKRTLPYAGGVPYTRQQPAPPAASLPKVLPQPKTAPPQRQQQQQQPQQTSLATQPQQKVQQQTQQPMPVVSQQQNFIESEYDDGGYYDQEQLWPRKKLHTTNTTSWRRRSSLSRASTAPLRRTNRRRSIRAPRQLLSSSRITTSTTNSRTMIRTISSRINTTKDNTESNMGMVSTILLLTSTTTANTMRTTTTPTRAWTP
jgi:hypothetical protein